ncbi:MAG: PKD domain-containing protein [Thermoplasmata archaeon]|nr:PKD domain-containing protein [Thermoplasmata archaeon]
MRTPASITLAILLGVLPAFLGIPALHVVAPPPTLGSSHVGHVPSVRSSGAPAGYPPDSWPTYMQNPERTGANLGERTLAVSNASNLSILWKLKTNGSDYSSPTVVNGTVYAGSWDGYEYAINASTGHILWKKNLGTDPNCSWGNPMGIDSTAAVWNATVFVGGGNGYWYALNAANGSVDWKIDVAAYSPGGGNYDWASSLLYHGYEYIGVASCIDSPLVQGRLLMVNLSGSHSVVHTFNFVPNGQTGSTIWTTSAADPATNEIWVATGNDDGTAQKLAESIVALNATNLTLVGHWQVSGVVGGDSDFGSGPTLFNDSSGRTLVAATNKNGVLYALNRSNVTDNGTWRPVWRVSTGGGFSPAAFDGRRLYAGGGSTISALDPKDGSTLWSHTTSGYVYGGLAYANGLVVDGSGSVLEVLNAANGSLIKSFTLASTQTINGAPSVAQGRIFFASGDSSTTGYFYAAGIPLGFSANESPAVGAAPLQVGTTGSPTGGMPPYNFTWGWGDGSVGYGRTPTHTYAQAGTFNISAQLRDAANQTQNASLQVVVGPPLVASIQFTPTTGPAPLNVTFTGTAQAGSGGPYNFSWNFGDGSPIAYANPIRHGFRFAGSYTTVLDVRDTVGHSTNATVLLSVGIPLSAVASGSPLAGTAPLQVLFTAAGGNGSPPYRYYWTFGDGSAASTLATVYHTFVQPGSFTTSVTVRDQTGSLRTRSLAISVISPLVASLSTPVLGSEVCPARTINATVQSAVFGGVTPYIYAWNFGDGSPVFFGGPGDTHTYRANGTYTITLTVSDRKGDSTNSTTTAAISLAVCPGIKPPPTGPPPPATSSSVTTTEWIGAGVVISAGVLAAAVWLVRRRARRP